MQGNCEIEPPSLKILEYEFCTNYSQTCIKRSPLGQGKNGLIRQVNS